MFTGIVEELGHVASISDLGDAARLVITGPLVTSDTRPGDSIAVNGVCLTVVEIHEADFSADVMLETLRRSSLGALAPGSRVNLPMAFNKRLQTHIKRYSATKRQQRESSLCK